MRYHGHTLAFLAVWAMVLLPSAAFADVPAVDPPEHRLAGFIDLTNGNVVILAPYAGCISVVNAPTDSNGDGWQEAVLRITIDPSASGACGITEACLILDYEGGPCGWTLNVGDSATNNGGSGDGGTQENDAEFQIEDQTATMYRSDVGGSSRAARHELSPRDGSLRVCISDGTLSMSNPRIQLKDDTFFALNGEADSGPGGVNYDVYVGLNRVVSGPGSRVGAGLARALITVK